MRQDILLFSFIVTVSAVPFGLGQDSPPGGYPGVLVPLQRVLLTSESAGRIQEIHVREGQTVKKGERLFRLERLREELEVKRAEAQLALAHSRFKTAEREGKARETLAVEIEVARVDVERARLALALREVFAPFEGTILRVNVEVGGYTNPAFQGLATTATLCELADLSRWQVEASVPGNAIHRFPLGQRCAIGIGGKKTRGIVKRVLPSIDRGRGTIAVWLEFEMPFREFTPRVDAAVLVEPLGK